MIKRDNRSGLPRRGTTITTDKLNTYPPLRKPLGLRKPRFWGLPLCLRLLFGVILGAAKLLPHPCFAKGALEASVYQGFQLFVILHNVCFMVCNASISGTSCTNFSPRAYIELMFFSCYWQHFLLLPSTLLRTLCKHSFHLLTAKVEIIYFKDFILYSQIVFVIVFALIIGV